MAFEIFSKSPDFSLFKVLIFVSDFVGPISAMTKNVSTLTSIIKNVFVFAGNLDCGIQTDRKI